MKILYTKSNTFIFIFLFILAFAVRLVYILYFKFDGLYGQDAYAYEECSKIFYNSIIALKAPPNFYWPIGFYIFSSLFALITAGQSALSSLLVSLNAGALTAGFMYLLSNEILKKYFTAETAKKYSIAAGLIICFAGITTKQSVVIMSDALALLFITASAYYLVMYYYKQKRVSIILCFAAVAFGIMTRYADGLFIFVMIPLIFSVFKKSRMKNKILIDVIWGITAGIIIFLPQLLYIYKYGFSYFHYWGNTIGMYASWNPMNMFVKDFTTVDGSQHYRLFNILFYISPALHPLFLSVFGIPFIYGLFNSFKNFSKILYVFLFSWIAVYVIYLSGNTFQAIRFALSFFPPLIIIAVWGLAEIKFKNIYKIIFISAGLILLAGYSFYDFGKFAERKKTEMESVNWIGSNVPPDANLYIFEVTGAVNYYTRLKAKEFFSYNFSRIKQSNDSAGGNTYFFLPVDRIHSQWKGLPIESTFDSIRNHMKLVSLGKVNDYEAYKSVK
jgi:dolichyl-phosphate-mannose-protein mannosyltransferase